MDDIRDIIALPHFHPDKRNHDCDCAMHQLHLTICFTYLSPRGMVVNAARDCCRPLHVTAKETAIRTNLRREQNGEDPLTEGAKPQHQHHRRNRSSASPLPRLLLLSSNIPSSKRAAHRPATSSRSQPIDESVPTSAATEVTNFPSRPQGTNRAHGFTLASPVTEMSTLTAIPSAVTCLRW